MLLCRKSMTILCTSRNSTLLAYGFSEIDPSMTICNRVLHENLLLLFQCALTLNSLAHRRMREISPICYSAQMLLASCGSFLKLLVMTLRFHTHCCVQSVIGSDVDQTVLLLCSILHLVLRHLNVWNCVKSSTYSRVIQYSTKWHVVQYSATGCYGNWYATKYIKRFCHHTCNLAAMELRNKLLESEWSHCSLNCCSWDIVRGVWILHGYTVTIGTLVVLGEQMVCCCTSGRTHNFYHILHNQVCVYSANHLCALHYVDTSMFLS